MSVEVPAGLPDATDALQAALDAYRYVRISAGAYLVDAVRSLRVPSGRRLRFEPGATLQAIPNDSPWSSILMVDEAEDVVIDGSGLLVGDRYAHSGSGEWGMGLSVVASERVRVSGLQARECWGDGIFVGWQFADVLKDNCRDIVLEDCWTNACRRNGVTLDGVIGCAVRRGQFVNTGGISPQAGIGIEPDFPWEAPWCRDILIEECITQGNAYQGLYAYHWHTEDITIRRHRSIADGQFGYVIDSDHTLLEDCTAEGASVVALDIRGNHIRVQGGDYCGGNPILCIAGAWTWKPTKTDIVIDSKRCGIPYSQVIA